MTQSIVVIYFIECLAGSLKYQNSTMVSLYEYQSLESWQNIVKAACLNLFQAVT